MFLNIIIITTEELIALEMKDDEIRITPLLAYRYVIADKIVILE